MELRQRRIQTTTSFAFGETELAYTFRQGQSVREVVFDYFDVARDRKFAAQRDWDRLQLGLLLTIAGVCLMVAQARMTGFTPFGALWPTSRRAPSISAGAQRRRSSPTRLWRPCESAIEIRFDPPARRERAIFQPLD